MLPEKDPQLPKTDVTETAETVTSLSFVFGSAVAPVVSPGSAGALARLSIISRLCPIEGVIEVDRVINPLGLELGERERVRQVNGALVGSIAIQTFLLLVSVCIAVYMYRRLGFKRIRQRQVDTCVPEREGGEGVRLMSRGLTTVEVTYLMARSRFGWILIPACFLYSGAAFTAVAALLYSTPFFQFVAVCDLSVFLFGLLAYATYVAYHACDHGEVEDIPDSAGRNCLLKIVWGTSEWVTFSERGHGAWVELNHLMYDGYRHFTRYWLPYELLISFGIGALGAWSPSADHCATQSTLMIALLSVFFLSLVVLRPYIALYENVMETAIAGLDVAIGVLAMVAGESDSPDASEHWAAQVAGHLGMAVVWMVSVKGLIDLSVFAFDEYALWKEIQQQKPPQKRKNFIVHLLCCGNNIPDESMDDYVRTKLGSEGADGGTYSLDALPEELRSLASTTGGGGASCAPPSDDLNSENGQATFETMHLPLGARRGPVFGGRLQQPGTPRRTWATNSDLQESLVSSDKCYHV